MISFTLRRLGAMGIMLLGVTFLVYLLMTLAPGDILDEFRAQPDFPAERVAEMEREFGLDQPWYVQYGRWLANVVRLEFGDSWRYRIPVFDLLLQRVPATLLLSLTSILFAWSMAIPLGVLAAVYKDSIFDRVSAFLAYAALSIPEFFLALLAVMLAASTGWFPTGGRTSTEHEFMTLTAQWGDLAYHLILPTIVLGIGGIAGMMRVMRTNFIDYMRAEFVTTARAKGLSERIIMFKHVLRNAVNPLITSFGYTFASLLSGALLVENVMNYPGLGQLVFQAITQQDRFVVLAGVMVGCVMLMLGNFLADLLLAKCDPRIRLEDSPGGIFSLVTGLIWQVRRTPGKAGMVFLVVLGVVLWAVLTPWDQEGVRAFYGRLLRWGGVAFLVLAATFALTILAVAARRLVPELIRRPLGIASLSVLGVLYLGALLAPFLAPYGPGEQDLQRSFHPPTRVVWDGGPAVRTYTLTDPAALVYSPVGGENERLRFFVPSEPYTLLPGITLERRFLGLAEEAEGRLYLLGSDSTGRDIFSRLLYGARISLTIGLIGISITMVMGFMVGGLSAYYGGNFDFIAMRVVEFLMAIPGLYLLLALRSALGEYFDSAQTFYLIVVILAIIGWAGTARVLRGMALSIRNRPFVLAVETMGQSTPQILIRHILPNLASYLLVAATLSIPGYILGEAALSFLGLGIEDPNASWGLMLSQAQQGKVFMLGLWWMYLPGVAIFLTVVAYNVLGDVLRDIVDPKGQIVRRGK